MKKFTLIAIILLLGGSVSAQQLVTGILKGKDGQPVMYANVAMLRADDSTFIRGTVTDQQGVYTLKNDTVATILRYSAMGYATLFNAVPNTRDGGPTGPVFAPLAALSPEKSAGKPGPGA